MNKRCLVPLFASSAMLVGCFTPSEGEDPTTTFAGTTGAADTGDPPATDTGPGDDSPPTATGTMDTSTSGADSTGESDESSGTTDPVVDTPIYDIQEGTVGAGEAVDVLGVVVTAVTSDGAFVEEPAGGMYSGVFVYTGAAPGVAAGDEVDVAGTTAEVMNMTTIDASAGQLAATGGAGVVPAPATVPLATLVGMTAEPWEGVLVRVEGAPLTVDAIVPSGFSVNDGGPSMGVGSGIFDVVTDPAAFPEFGVGADLSAVQGPLRQEMSMYRVLPRNAGDLEGYVPPITSETFDFPTAADTAMLATGSAPWNAGDYYEGLRNTVLPSVTSVDLHLEIINNGLAACGTQTANVIINGVIVGNFSVVQGTTAIDQTYNFPFIGGPAYLVRYQTLATVAAGCGAAGYSLATSTITFHQ